MVCSVTLFPPTMNVFVVLTVIVSWLNALVKRETETQSQNSMNNYVDMCNTQTYM